MSVAKTIIVRDDEQEKKARDVIEADNKEIILEIEEEITP